MSSPTLETSDANCPVGGVFKIREILYWDSLRAKPFNLRVEVTELIPHFLSPSWFFILLGDSRSAPSSWQMAGGFSQQTSGKGGCSLRLYVVIEVVFFMEMEFLRTSSCNSTSRSYKSRFDWIYGENSDWKRIANLFAFPRILSLGYFP